jgi:transformation/transcription domain-associated protein
MMHKPALGNNLHVVFAKMMFGLTDIIAVKETPQGAAKLLEALFETCLEKLESLCVVYTDLRGEHSKEKVATGDSGSDAMLVEKARPACAAVYASERPEEVFHGPLFFRPIDFLSPSSCQSREWFFEHCCMVSAFAFSQ